MTVQPDAVPSVDPAADTQPVRTVDPFAQTRLIDVQDDLEATRQHRPQPPATSRRKLSPRLILLVLAVLALLYFFSPLRTNVLILGIDRAPGDSALGRSDTFIVMSVNRFIPTISGFSIPRDLWVSIPGYGENRINTAHFFAEAAQEGQGPYAAMDTVQHNFDLHVPYYLRFRFEVFKHIVDALGGIDIYLESAMGGFPAGSHHLDSEQALVFVRDRSGTDDFFRMAQAQTMVRAVIRQSLNPFNWPRLPSVVWAALGGVDTNLPVWQWPRLLFSFVLSGVTGFDMHTLERDMVQPFVTSEGAQVLLPVWERINPEVRRIFW